jgi:hypothetical protein
MDAYQNSPSQEKLGHPQLEGADEGNLLWDEYTYRHDLIWRHLIRSTLVLVALVTVTYSKAFNLTIWVVGIAWIVAVGYWLITLLAIEPELQLYIKIKNLHRERQNHYFDLQLKKTLINDKLKWGKVFFVDDFSRRVAFFLLLLLVVMLFVLVDTIFDAGVHSFLHLN